MERGSEKHSARADDELAKGLEAQLHRGGAQPEPWTEPEPLVDDPDLRPVPTPSVPTPADMPARQRLREVGDDLGPGDTVRDAD